jgi:hypothetical protein
MPLTANDYRIEKSRRQVAVTTLDGERLVGDVFLQAYAHRRHGPEAPTDLLNDDEPFFPLALVDGGTVLLAKERVREVEIPGERATDDDDPYAAAGVRWFQVELTLLGNVLRSGSIRVELPFERPRLLDFFNRFSERFLTLDADDGVRLVNRRCIERVRPLDA